MSIRPGELQFHVEYDYEQQRQITFYTPEEIELLKTQRFLSQPQRCGIVRLNRELPVSIEIPFLDPPLYDRDEMASWLQTFKQTQPATLTRHEAETRYQTLLEEKRKTLLDSPPVSVKTKTPKERTKRPKLQPRWPPPSSS